MIQRLGNRLLWQAIQLPNQILFFLKINVLLGQQKQLFEQNQRNYHD